MKKIYSLLFILLFLTVNSMAAKLVEVLPVDNQCLVLHFQDGMVEYNWDDTISGSCNGWNYYYTENWHLCPDKDQYIPFGMPLNTSFTNRNYPEDKEIWPWGEHFWNSRYSVPNSEATPQQTFRQKIVLYGYLYGMNKRNK